VVGGCILCNLWSLCFTQRSIFGYCEYDCLRRSYYGIVSICDHAHEYECGSRTPERKVDENVQGLFQAEV